MTASTAGASARLNAVPRGCDRCCGAGQRQSMGRNGGNGIFSIVEEDEAGGGPVGRVVGRGYWSVLLLSGRVGLAPVPWSTRASMDGYT